LYDKAVETGLAVYRAIGCSGIARVDMLIDSKTNKVYFNEVNPLPGSLYAHNWSRAGVSATDLVTKLVDLAEERWQYQQSKTVSFETNFLGQF
jgi:D-alanine-D-alanine ligase